MTETVTNAPICKTVNCKKELTYLEDAKCWRCLVCNPLPKAKPAVESKTKYLDVKVTEERVREIFTEQEERIREIVRDELENWYIQRPPVTREEVPETWRQQAKRLGIPVSQQTGGVRKKVDVLADIAEATNDGGDPNGTLVKGD